MAIEASESLLRDVTTQILEDAAFLLLDTAEGFAGWEEDVIDATIPFDGPSSGTVRLVTCRGLAAEIAANMLGIDGVDPDARANEVPALGELVNIVAGAMVAKLWGTRVACDLGLPEVAVGGARSWPSPGAIASALCDGEGRTIGVELRLADAT